MQISVRVWQRNKFSRHPGEQKKRDRKQDCEVITIKERLRHSGRVTAQITEKINARNDPALAVKVHMQEKR